MNARSLLRSLARLVATQAIWHGPHIALAPQPSPLDLELMAIEAELDRLLATHADDPTVILALLRQEAAHHEREIAALRTCVLNYRDYVEFVP